MNRYKLLAPVAALLLTGCATQPQVASCTRACSSHEEGYQWAQGANLTDPAACDGQPYPAAFVEGCRDGVEDLYQLRRATRSL